MTYAVAGDAQGNPTTGSCGHLDRMEVLDAPPERVCEDCVREGSRWVHLRRCTICGHVGCCDNSPRRHATAHYHSTSHPIIRSAEPSEDWAWCYVDELILMPADA